MDVIGSEDRISRSVADAAIRRAHESADHWIAKTLDDADYWIDKWSHRALWLLIALSVSVAANIVLSAVLAVLFMRK